ncbi:MAG: hypothetical protein HYX82_04070 [Chloroflexi bacterium]|nr:hypothetical protein [Chloroflexota bacterium]
MRIGINVPDKLLKRMEPVRQLMNLSQVCREAIESRVNAYERALVRAQRDGMETVAERLWQGQSAQTIDWEALGLEDGKLWVQLASQKDWEYLLHRLEVLKRQQRSPGSWVVPYLVGTKTFSDRWHENKEWFYRQYELDENTDHHQQAESAYTRGLLSYLTAVWQMVSVKRTPKLDQGQRRG